MAKYFITGITGSLGQAVMRKLLKDEKNQVIGYSRDELKQSQIPSHQRLTLYIGDIRDQRRLVEATRDVDVIFHFAALKRIEAGEENPDEFKATNVNGTDNVLYAQRSNGVRRVVLSSTDKACFPQNVYGATKLLSERSVLRNQNNVVCRYGNVLASRGSVVPMFVDSILREKTVYITDPKMTRFFITLDQASDFVISRGLGKKGGLYIPNIKGAGIIDVASTVAVLLGVKSPKMKIIGSRPGEKLHEVLRCPYEGGELTSENCERFTDKELLELVRPIVESITGVSTQKRRVLEGHA